MRDVSNPDIKRAMGIVRAELGGQALQPGSEQWIKDRPILRLRVLILFKREVKGRMAQMKQAMVNGRANSGDNPSQEYWNWYRGMCSSRNAQQRYLSEIELKIAETEMLFGGQSMLSQISEGHFVTLLADFKNMAQAGDFAGIEGKADAWIEKVAGKAPVDKCEDDQDAVGFLFSKIMEGKTV